MFKVPEENRVRSGQMWSDESFGNNGAFIFEKFGYRITCIASDEFGWDHVSVTIDRKRTPTWEIMSFIKDQFWDETDTVIQFHPKKSEYVNMHPYCLHLWRNQNQEYELPDSILVGIQKSKEE